MTWIFIDPMDEAAMQQALDNHERLMWQDPMIDYHMHVANGRHSGIPECCVQFYSRQLRHTTVELNAWRHQHYDHVPAYTERTNYVPCPACFEKIIAGDLEPARVHQCDEDQPPCNWSYSGEAMARRCTSCS